MAASAQRRTPAGRPGSPLRDSPPKTRPKQRIGTARRFGYKAIADCIFLCATDGVRLELAFQQKFSAGLFGGEGFRLQKLVGNGLAFVELSGELIERQLQAGEVLRVHPGHVGMFKASVGFGITTVPGIKNKFFGGDGIFLAELTGPGKLWLQSMPLANLAAALAPYLAADDATASTEGAAAGVGAAKLIGGFLKS